MWRKAALRGDMEIILGAEMTDLRQSGTTIILLAELLDKGKRARPHTDLVYKRP
jgi:hypothetical protein